MENFVVNTFEDSQTAILSLAGAVAGAAAEAVTSVVVQQTGTQGARDMGRVGVNFAIGAVVSSAMFAAAARAMPATSENVFFTIVFFAANRSLVTSAVSIGNAIIHAVMGTTHALRGPPAGTGPVDSSSSCASGGCGK